MSGFDIKLFQTMNGYAAAHPSFGAWASFCAGPLIWLMAIAVVVRAVSLAMRHDSRAAAFAAAMLRAGAAAGAALLGNWLFGRLVWFRERPFVDLYGVHLLTAAPYGWQSFPSGHSAAAFAMATSVFFEDRHAGAVLLFAAACVATGRVFAGVHYPLDVLAGAAAGILWAWAARPVGRSLKDVRALQKAVKYLQS